jgi:hypothetical protein
MLDSAPSQSRAGVSRVEEGCEVWGVISIYVPCEPGLILRLFRFVTTNIKARRQGYDHYAIHYLEHRNYYISMKYMIKSAFKADSIKRVRFPLPLLSWNFNFFEIYQIE